MSERGSGPPNFVQPRQPADVTALVVTFNSAEHVAGLLGDLRREARNVRIRAVVVDNASSDDTVAVVGLYEGVVIVRSGGNVGYAAAINRGMLHVGSHEPVLVLNPDLRVEEGAVAALLDRVRQGVAVAVPRILDPDGSTFASLRREPTLGRVLGEGLLGSRVRSRPGWLSETVRSAASYEHPGPVDWATGAAMLVAADVAREVGAWDERYFLYSEETDFLRRVRARGGIVWYEPKARVVHAGGGSGSSDALVALMAVNKLRYADAHHSRPYAAALRACLLATALLRPHRSGQRLALAMLMERGRWNELPKADPPVKIPAWPPAGRGSVVIPAYNEAAVIERTLRPLVPLAEAGHVEVVVACNGCTDQTADLVRRQPSVTLVDIPQASKTAALNAADAVASRWPRVYLDADIDVPPEALRDLMAVLGRRDGPPAGRPPFTYDAAGASWLVRRYYRARLRMPSTQRALWGAGLYGLSEAGRHRFGGFPDLTGDDLFVDRLFCDAEKVVVETAAVTVHTPRDLEGLMAILRRQYRGNDEITGLGRAGGVATGWASGLATASELARSVRSPRSLLDAGAYFAFAVVGRLAAHRAVSGWDRDESSRAGGTAPGAR